MGNYFPWEVPQKALWLSRVVRWGSEDSLKRSLLLQAEAQSCWLPSGSMGNTTPSCLSKEDEPGYLFTSTLLSLERLALAALTPNHIRPHCGPVGPAMRHQGRDTQVANGSVGTLVVTPRAGMWGEHRWCLLQLLFLCGHVVPVYVFFPTQISHLPLLDSCNSWIL